MKPSNPYNKILNFHHILILHNHTKIYTLVSIRSNIDKPKQTGLFVNTWAFLISTAYTFSVKNFVVWWFGYDAKQFFSFLSLSLVHLCFLTFSIVFQKTALFINLKKSFSIFFGFCLSLVFISIYGFSHTFWLSLITLWTSSKTNPWFNACFKFLMWMTF